MKQRDYERDLWSMLGGELDAKEMETEIAPFMSQPPKTDAEWDRLGRAISQVSDQCNRRSQ